MAFYRSPKNLISEGTCPDCDSIIQDTTIDFTLTNEEITDDSIGGRILINTFGNFIVKRCYLNHEYIMDIEWKNVCFSCASCHKQLINDENTIKCKSCDYETNYLSLMKVYKKVILATITHMNFQSTSQQLTKFFNWEDGLRKWTDLLNNFFESYRLENAPTPIDSDLPDLIEYYPNGRVIHPILKYRAIGLLTYGGFSKIYLAQDKKDRYVIIKVPWGYHNNQEKGIEKRINPYIIAEDKIHTESTFLQNIKGHKNFVRFIEEYNYDDTLHLVIDYLKGPTLNNYLKDISKSKGRLSEGDIKDLMEQVIKIIKVIHNKMNLVHRDITPSNFMLIDKRLVMIDFGTVASDTGIENTSRTGIQAGGYHSPQEAQGISSKINDIYSLGSLMYFILTTKEPEEPRPNMPTDRVMQYEMQKIRTPKQLQNIIMKARTFSIAERYQTINELHSDLVELWYPGKRLCLICGDITSKSIKFCEHCGSIQCSNCGTSINVKTSLVCNNCHYQVCRRCGTASSPESKFCVNCGRALISQQRCQYCSQQISFGAIFCNNCGQKTPIIA